MVAGRAEDRVRSAGFPVIAAPSFFRCRLEWSRRGARAAAERGDILVIVDVLSFSTAVATAVHHGLRVYPRSGEDDPHTLARRVGAEVAVGRTEVPEKGRFSLSPGTFEKGDPGTRVVLPSPNGGTCARYGREVPLLFAGALVNARAVAAAVSVDMERSDRCVTVLACGERWKTPSEDGDLRFASEDYLGAGAILSYLHHPKTPAARLCEGAFVHARSELEALLLECDSGRELRERGFVEDVERAARLDVYDAAPVLRDGCFERL